MKSALKNQHTVQEDPSSELIPETNMLNSCDIQHPVQSQLQKLLHLTQVGQIKKVIVTLENLRDQNPQTDMFCSHLISLAKRYKVEEMESYISSTLN